MQYKNYRLHDYESQQEITCLKNYRLHDYESQQDRAISGPHLTEPLLQREETLHLGGGDIYYYDLLLNFFWVMINGGGTFIILMYYN